MRVRLDDATAAQLREFYRARYGGQIHETAGVKAVLDRLERAGFDGGEIEIGDPDDAPALLVDGIEPQIDVGAEAEKGVQDLVAAGWNEGDARKLLGFSSDGRPPGPRGGHEVEDRLVAIGYSRRLGEEGRGGGLASRARRAPRERGRALAHGARLVRRTAGPGAPVRLGERARAVRAAGQGRSASGVVLERAARTPRSTSTIRSSSRTGAARFAGTWSRSTRWSICRARGRGDSRT